MSKPLKAQIVEKARALIEDERHWCRGELAGDADMRGHAAVLALFGSFKSGPATEN